MRPNRWFSRLKPELTEIDFFDNIQPEMIEIICGYCYQPTDVCHGQCPDLMLEGRQIERDIALRKLKAHNGGVLVF